MPAGRPVGPPRVGRDLPRGGRQASDVRVAGDRGHPLAGVDLLKANRIVAQPIDQGWIVADQQQPDLPVPGQRYQLGTDAGLGQRIKHGGHLVGNQVFQPGMQHPCDAESL